jgi:hypothetical protein
VNKYIIKGIVLFFYGAWKGKDMAMVPGVAMRVLLLDGVGGVGDKPHFHIF